MEKHNIGINVLLDREKMPEHIEWSATGKEEASFTPAKAFMLSLWDGAEKTALRMDLWTKQMMVDEMIDFFFQTLVTMSDTFDRATQNEELAKEFKNFAYHFREKAIEKLQQEEGGEQ